MAEAMPGVKIVRPGLRYYFDDETPKCPQCGAPDLEYRCRVVGMPRTAQFKCASCQCKFEKTRTVETEPEGYTPASRGCGQFHRYQLCRLWSPREDAAR